MLRCALCRLLPPSPPPVQHFVSQSGGFHVADFVGACQPQHAFYKGDVVQAQGTLMLRRSVCLGKMLLDSQTNRLAVQRRRTRSPHGVARLCQKHSVRPSARPFDFCRPVCVSVCLARLALRRRSAQPDREGCHDAARHPHLRDLERHDPLLELPPQPQRLHAFLQPRAPPSVGLPCQPGAYVYACTSMNLPKSQSWRRPSVGIRLPPVAFAFLCLGQTGCCRGGQHVHHDLSSCACERAGVTPLREHDRVVLPEKFLVCVLRTGLRQVPHRQFISGRQVMWGPLDLFLPS
jgi:hypothetical protein